MKKGNIKLFCLAGGGAIWLLLFSLLQSKEMKQPLLSLRDNFVDYLWARSDDCWHEGEYDYCIKINRLIVTLDPSFVDAYLTSAWLADSMGREEEAKGWLEEAVKKAPSWESYSDIGLFYLRRKEYKKAEEYYRKACTDYSPPPYVWRMFAHSLYNQGKIKEAVEVLEKAVKKYPNDAITLSLLERFKKEVKEK
jgi:tetratricopeptide (TPR) repeat protein